MFSSTTSSEEKVVSTIQNLPDQVIIATKCQIQECEGKVDYKTKIELTKEELDKIEEESKERLSEHNVPCEAKVIFTILRMCYHFKISASENMQFNGFLVINVKFVTNYM